MESGNQARVAGHAAAGRIMLAVALGNPGERYASTRHNAGIWLVEALTRRRGLSFAKVGAIAAKVAGTAAGLRLGYVEAYMNESGAPVQRLLNFYKLAPASLLVLHDEADLPAGAARLKFGGGLAGHNGLRDVAAHLATKQFWRLRLGVGPAPAAPEGATGRRGEEELAAYVLKKPPAAERDLIDAAIARVGACWDQIEAGALDAATKQLHTASDAS